MLTSPDFKELLRIFEKHSVRYLIVGGYAVMKYSEPRFTNDLIRAKEASARPQDKRDLEKLKKIKV
jgi:hypothetical protein